MSMVLMTAAGLSHGASAAPLGRGARAVAPVDALLELKGVHTHIGAYHILHGVDLVVPKGQLTMLLAARQARNAAHMDAQRLQWIFKLFPPVETFWNHPAGKLSGGQKQMVAVARAMVEPRDLLIIDEPSKGLAPAIINNMIEAFDQLKKSGVTILLVEQNIHFAKRLGDTVAVMDNGQVVHAGSMAALAEDEALQRSLLGLAL